MDVTDRASRQLMRQRGAGLRNNNNVDFGLEFGSHQSREDRQLMRQRGAGNRKINNIDFGFSFPTPNQSRRSSRTPQTARQRIERSSKTPLSVRNRQKPVAQPQQAIVSNVDAQQNDDQVRSVTPQLVIEAERANSGKKRRLNPDSIARKPIHSYTNVSSVSRSRAPSLPSTEVQVNENDEEYPHPISSPLFFPDYNDKENAEIYENTSSSWKSTRKQPRRNVGLREVENETLSSTAASPSVPVALSTEKSRLYQSNLQIDNTDLAESEAAPSDVVGSSSTPLPSTNPEPRSEDNENSFTKQSRRKRKRKSVILGPRKRRSSARKSATPVPEPSFIAEEPSAELIGSDEEPEERQSTPNSQVDADESVGRPLPLWKQIITDRRQGRQSRLSVPTSPVRDPHDNEEEDESYVDDEDEDALEELATPTEKRKKTTDHVKTQGRRPKNIIQVGRRRKGKNNTFPILTHRMTNTNTLPTILEEDEHDRSLDEDDLQLPPAFSNRNQPNAVDILAQICRETIQSAVNNLDADSNIGRAELKNRRETLEAFSEALDERLFEMSEAVENRLNLEARLRKTRREKAELQARWMEVRRQRDELALRADVTRRQNWDDEEEGRRQWEVSELAHSMELEVERNEPDDGHDLEVLLKHVGRTMSHAGGRGAILSRVRAFNSQLERIATALEQ